LRIHVLHRGPYPPGSEIKVEKIEIEMKYLRRPDVR
jgi:hypothetical protein